MLYVSPTFNTPHGCCRFLMSGSVLKVREIFSEYDPHFMPVSLDEAYLDITEHLEQRKHWPETMRTHHMCDAKTGVLLKSTD